MKLPEAMLSATASMATFARTGALQRTKCNSSASVYILEDLLGFVFEKTRRVLGGYEMDGYSYELKIGVEYDGPQREHWIKYFQPCYTPYRHIRIISVECKRAMDTYVFVYGTLRRGLYNHETYLEPAIACGKAVFVGTARTARAEFHLALDDHVFYPCLYRAPTELYRVPGEVYRVDDDALAALDVLEEIDEGLYHRDDVAVQLLDGALQGQTRSCQTYVMAFRDELLALERIAEYTPEMNARYAALMGEPQLAVLEWLYDRKVIRAVEAKLGDGVSFAEAWSQVLDSSCRSSDSD